METFICSAKFQQKLLVLSQKGFQKPLVAVYTVLKATGIDDLGTVSIGFKKIVDIDTAGF
jgi:hypothetical protein